MDVPTRQSYTMAVVRPDERSAASGITTVARSIGAAISPALAGYCLARPELVNVPFFVAGTVKIVAAVAVCCLAAELARRWGRRVTVILLAGCASASLLISSGTGLGLGWIGALGSSAQLHSWLAPTNQLGFLIGGLGALGGANWTATAIAVMVRIGAVAGVLAAGWLLWPVFRGRRDPVTGLGLVFVAMLVTGPVVQPWYLLWAILPLAASVHTARARRVLVAVSAVSAMALPPVGGSVAALVSGYLCAVVLLIVILAACRSTGRYAGWRDLSEMSEPDADRGQERRTHRAMRGLPRDLP